MYYFGDNVDENTGEIKSDGIKYADEKDILLKYQTIKDILDDVPVVRTDESKVSYSGSENVVVIKGCCYCRTNHRSNSSLHRSAAKFCRSFIAMTRPKINLCLVLSRPFVGVGAPLRMSVLSLSTTF